MARLEILEYPDTRLARQSEEVTVFDNALTGLVDDLFDTLYASNAIGLSAPQVDAARNIVVMDHSGNATAPQLFINPVIGSRAGLVIADERCLSVPGVTVKVLRAAGVAVTAQDSTGTYFERELSGMDAVCLQHEMDHLAGKVLVDHLWFPRRHLVRARAQRRRRDQAVTTAVADT